MVNESNVRPPGPQPTWDVAVVGAGPVGLLLAGELAARDVRVGVLERAEAPSLIPKANGIVGHAGVALAQCGVLAGTGLKVVSPPRFQFGPLTLDLGLGPRNPLHILPVPQRRLEEILERRAARRGVQVCRGHDVIGFTQDHAGVQVEVGRRGVATQVRVRYLVGCDGARSLVRKHAGIAFPGYTSDQIARIARVTIPSDRITRTREGVDIPGVGPVAMMRPNQFSGGGFSIAPVAALDHDAPEDLYLISTREPRGEAEPSDDVSIEELRASLRRVLGAELPFTEAASIRSTVGNSRQADAYRLGRVFLAGDAAHLFDAGGSSLNVGLQDALELAARLGAVLGKRATAEDLDGYEQARRAAGERALRHTRAQAALTRDDEGSRALREIVATLAAGRSGARVLARLIERA